MNLAIIDVQQRLERGTGTILVAARLLADGWVNEGFVSIPYSYGMFWAALSYILDSYVVPGGIEHLPAIALVSGGDHCGANCDQKAQEIVAWVGQAIETAIEYAYSLAREYHTPFAVVSFGFTQRGADVWGVIEALLNTFRDSAVPIIVSWTDQNGQVWYMCIGSASACDALGDRARRIACAQQGRRGCRAIQIPIPAEPWGEPPPPPPPGPITITPGDPGGG